MIKFVNHGHIHAENKQSPYDIFSLVIRENGLSKLNETFRKINQGHIHTLFANVGRLDIGVEP